MSTLSELRTHVVRLLADKGDTKPLDDHDSLVLSGRFDSTDVLEMVILLESEYGIDFGDQPFDQEDFDSVARIAGLVELRAPTAATKAPRI